MSQANLNPNLAANQGSGQTRPEKPPLNVYTVMLIISMISLIFGTVMLYQSLNQFGAYPQWSTREAKIQG